MLTASHQPAPSSGAPGRAQTSRHEAVRPAALPTSSSAAAAAWGHASREQA